MGDSTAGSVLESLSVTLANSPAEKSGVGPLVLRHRDVFQCRIKIFLGYYNDRFNWVEFYNTRKGR